jgi:monoamine oxidase
LRVAVVGGGPGGLFSAWHLASNCGTAVDVTIYEASDRVGGKIVTKHVPGVGIYEAGVAEIYDYSALGPDPLRELITQELGLEVKDIAGGACTMDGQIFPDMASLEKYFGRATSEAAINFRKKCAAMLTPESFYKSERIADNMHPWTLKAADEVLDEEIPDPAARQYIRVMSHSDVAAPPHLTNGITFLKNALMDVDGYLNVISVAGGNEKIVEGLVDMLDANIKLNSQVRSVQPLPDGTYKLVVGSNGSAIDVLADYVIFALPITALAIIDWRSPALQHAINSHINYFDRPGHYLRATLIFERPFWRDQIPGDWWMSDAFDGCCVYDEGARHDLGKWGALGFLIAGNAALGLVNMSDERIQEMCLESLPPSLEFGKKLFTECKVHRWMASVNAIPGGSPVRDRGVNHQPLSEQMPGVFIVGDYLFDSTLNGVLDSADTATDIIVAKVLERRRQQTSSVQQKKVLGNAAKTHQQTSFDRYFEAKFTKDILELVWGLQPSSRILLAGSRAGGLLASYREAGLDAYSVATDALTRLGIPSSMKKYHTKATLTDLPYANGYFDIVIETDLCALSSAQIPAAIDELKRVSKMGIVCGSVCTDLTIEMIERQNLLEGVVSLNSRWQWADYLFAKGFKHSLTDPLRLGKVWERAKAEGAGVGHWFEDAESMLFAFYSPDAEMQQFAEFDAVLQAANVGSKAVHRVPILNEKILVSRS